MEPTFPLRTWIFVWYTCICFMGTIGNCIVLIVIARNKDLLFSPFNIFILALAITDLLVSLVGLPNYLLSTDLFAHPTGHQGDLLCKFFTGYFCPFWFLEISVFLLVLIALERKRAIVEPFSVLVGTPFIKTLGKLVSAVLLAFCLGIPTIYGMEYDKNRPVVGSYCRYTYTFVESIVIYVSVFLIDTVTPLVIMVYCFVQIKNALKTSKALHESSLQAYKNSNSYERRRKQHFASIVNTNKTLIYVMAAFFVCIIPNHLLYIVSLLGVRGLEWNSNICQFGVLMRFSNSCINPILYALKSSAFNKHFRGTFKQNKRFAYGKEFAPN